MGVTIYKLQMSNSGNYKETQDFWSFQTDLFQKAPDQKSSNKA